MYELTISAAVIAVLIAEGLFSLALPIVTLVIWKKKYDLPKRPFVMGIAAFFIFGVVGQQLLHLLVLDMNPVIGNYIESQPWLNALYVGFAAGLFEETARLMMFRTALKDETSRESAVAYGIGHAGVECIVALGLTVMSNLIIAYIMNSGNLADSIAAMSPEELAVMQETVNMTNDISVSGVILVVLERICMFVLQIELSIVVFAAYKNEKMWLYPVAIAAHAMVELIPTLYHTNMLPLWPTEILLVAYVALLMLPVSKIYKSLQSIVPVATDNFGRPVDKKYLL